MACGALQTDLAVDKQVGPTTLITIASGLQKACQNWTQSVFVSTLKF